MYNRGAEPRDERGDAAGGQGECAVLECPRPSVVLTQVGRFQRVCA
jgi:hypothetical protein